MWNKKGKIHDIDHYNDWMVSHACVPTALLLDENTIRIYYAPRNAEGKSIPTYIDVAAENPGKILYIHDQPILELGELGTFDDGGIMPCSVVRLSETCIYMYYVGWNASVMVPYRNAIGLAISHDNGKTFQKAFRGSIVERNRDEPFFTASPCVIKQNDQWIMWYASSTGFVINDGKTEPLYEIKYAYSDDGINWKRPNITCIPPAEKYQCTARPTVIVEDGKYKMWFTYRGSFDYRDGADSYKIGYAESFDAINWIRDDQASGIGYSESGWDSTMQTYPSVVEVNNQKILFYNGNGFGKTGIGYAIWKEK
ncbi:hypothetical protein [uncultured Chryseobacterium sp.]|uniref:hypothetical protein n=1 Tax=uncultured Chryseobacterium sp. TaxID=259322 RepID=UPI0025D34C31|nr:hypothetical protein [uncultured Chryseobacterium sp.]